MIQQTSSKRPANFQQMY